MARKRTRRKRSESALALIILIVVAAVVLARHLPTTEAVLTGAGIGLIVGAVLGYRKGRHRAVASPHQESATTASAQPKRIKAKMVSPQCLEGNCGACSGINCGHCEHPGRQRSRARTVPEEPPF